MTCALPRIARRVFNRPQLITQEGARMVLAALAPRLGVASLRDGSGESMSLQIDTPPERDRRTFAFDAETGIATIPISGELVFKSGDLDPVSGMTGYDGIKIKLLDAIAAAEVRGILFDIDSPGGEAAGVVDLAEMIFAASRIKPIWAIANELAASAAYFLASAAGNVFLPRTGEVGSIGVVLLHTDISEQLANQGVEVTLIFAGDRKVDGNPFEPLPARVRRELQAGVNEIYELFVNSVARFRGLTPQAVRATEAGVFMGGAAVAVGLADAVASEDEVYSAFASRLAELNSGGLRPAIA